MPLLKVNQIASYSGNTLTVGTTGDTVTLATGASSSGFGATYNGAVNWTSNVVTSALTVSAGIGYFVNTSSAAITATLPASPTAGSTIAFTDYNRTWATNNFTINPNSNKYQGGTVNAIYSTNGQSVTITYADSTKGWIPTVDDDATNTQSYSIDFLVVAGGGAGGGGTPAGTGGYVGAGGGAGGYRTSTQTVNGGTVITVTVGDGGSAVSTGVGTSGSNSSISGSGLTTITSAGGGGGGVNGTNGANGGSGGGGGSAMSPFLSGSGNTPSTSPSQGNNGGLGSDGFSAYTSAGGGGGAGAVGGNASNTVGGAGGNGTASSITGSSVTYAGGGGGVIDSAAGTSGTGGTGGGGNGAEATPATSPTAGTANLGGGGGGAYNGVNSNNSGAGGKGVVILRMLSTSYSGTTTGSPTVTTDGSYKVVKFTGSGSYTA